MFRNYLPAWLWALLILVLTLMPGQYLPKVDYWSITSLDKYIHFGIFLIQVFLLLVGEKRRKGPLRLGQYVGPFLAGTGFGILIEFIQILIPHRSCDVEDMIANTIGALLGAVIFLLFSKMKVNKVRE